ncbi:MAG: RIO1 family regulatory kinase/ATPase [Balneolales bacterium]
MGKTIKNPILPILTKPGLTTFIFDMKVVESGAITFLNDFFFDHGFDIIYHNYLDAVQKQKYLDLVERKNWNTDISNPGYILTVLDLNPLKPNKKTLEYYPQLDNAHIFFKDWAFQKMDIFTSNQQKKGTGIKGYFQRYTARMEGYYKPFIQGQDIIDSTLNSAEAWQIIDHVIPEMKPYLEHQIVSRHKAYKPPFPIIKVLSGRGKNARVDLIDYKGKKAVCKTFRIGREEAFIKELKGLQLSAKIQEIPKPYASGENWVVMEYHEMAMDLEAFTFIPIKLAEKIFATLKKLFNEGFAHLDFNKNNIIVTEDESVYIIDFEDLHKYNKQPGSFKDSYDISGVINDGDIPSRPPRTYNYWYPLIGLKFDSLMNDSFYLKSLKRILYIMSSFIKNPLRDYLVQTKSSIKKLISKKRIADPISGKRRTVQPYVINPLYQ